MSLILGGDMAATGQSQETEFMRNFIDEVEQVPALSADARNDLIKIGRELEAARKARSPFAILQIGGRETAQRGMFQIAWAAQRNDGMPPEMAERGWTPSDIESLRQYGPIQAAIMQSPAHPPRQGNRARHTDLKARATDITADERAELLHVQKDIDNGTASQAEVERAQGVLHGHNYDIGTFGVKHDGVDGKAGNFTKGALSRALNQGP
jgi:hypothetical protein